MSKIMIHLSENVLLWASQKLEICSSVLLLLLACMLLELTVYGNCTGNLNKLFFSLLAKLTLRSETSIHFLLHVYAFSVIEFPPCVIHVPGLMCRSELSCLFCGFWIACLIAILAWWRLWMIAAKESWQL